MVPVRTKPDSDMMLQNTSYSCVGISYLLSFYELFPSREGKMKPNLLSNLNIQLFML